MQDRRVTQRRSTHLILSFTTPILVMAFAMSGCAPAEPPRKPAESKSAKTVPEKRSAAAVVKAKPSEVEVSTAEPSAAVSHAKALYGRHCTACHGETGDGQGLAAKFLFPKPRNFRVGHFRLVSTSNGAPTAHDIVSVLKRGMPGSSMPPWPNLKDDELKLLADFVVELRRAAIRDQEQALAKDGGYEVTPEDIDKTVAQLTTPGTPIEVPAIGSSNADAVERGKTLFLKSCASCHGALGKGDGQQAMVDVEGFPTRPRDLTKGIFKGNYDPQSVYRRISAGLPGSPMPALREATPEQVADMVHYVLSLSSEETRKQATTTRERIVATYVKEIVDSSDATLWEKSPTLQLRLTPLWWRDNFEPNLGVQAIHDGKSIAVRLTWGDATPNRDSSLPEQFEDMVALELFEGATEPFLGMGATDGVVDLWHWRAGAENVSASDDLAKMDDYPFDTPTYRDVAKGNGIPDFLTARAAGNPIVTASGQATGLTAKGPGSLTFLPKPSQAVRANAAWSEGRWNVVFTRPLAVPKEDGVSVSAGNRCSIAFAVWDGSLRDRAAQKLTTIWNDLVLDAGAK